MSKQVFVVGLRRSGSSMTAGILHTLGIRMGDVLHGPSPSNEKGHFEDRKLQALMDRIVGQWNNPRIPVIA